VHLIFPRPRRSRSSRSSRSRDFSTTFCQRFDKLRRRLSPACCKGGPRGVDDNFADDNFADELYADASEADDRRHGDRGLARMLCLYLSVLLLVVEAGCSDSLETKKFNRDETTNQSESSPKSPTQPDSEIRLSEITPDCGLHFVPRTGQEDGRLTILESLGTGVAVVDIDRDQNLDVIAIGGGTFDAEGIPQGEKNGVFRQREALRFDSVSDSTGLSDNSRYTHGVSAGDWNNDGFEDVLITGFRSIRLFQNCGDGTFEDVSSAAGFPQDLWSTSSAFLDADNDGDLEFYIVNYVNWSPENNPECHINGHRDVCAPGSFAAISDLLFDNNGDGTFQNITQTAGLNEGGKGLAVISGDVDLDGDTDLYVANDTNANFLYLNDGHGHFTDNALVAGCALGPTMDAEGSMGVEFADFNQDRLPDIWVSNYENQSFAMYESRAPGVFQHVSAIRGISAVGRLFVGFGTGAFDADLDGDQDIYAANGHVMYGQEMRPAPQLPLVYENLNGMMFRNVASLTGYYGNQVHMGRGVAIGDLDQDGRADLTIAHSNEPLSVLQNTTTTTSDWVAVELIGQAANRSAIGAFAMVNDSVRLVTGGGSYLSDSANQLIWAVPPGTKTVKIEVVWASGLRQLDEISTGTVNIVRERVEQKNLTR
jgi:hypothetical protein